MAGMLAGMFTRVEQIQRTGFKWRVRWRVCSNGLSKYKGQVSNGGLTLGYVHTG
jgi:hypothetical protein